MKGSKRKNDKRKDTARKKEKEETGWCGMSKRTKRERRGNKKSE